MYTIRDFLIGLILLSIPVTILVVLKKKWVKFFERREQNEHYWYPVKKK